MKKLTVYPRKDLKKSETNRIRREGNVPGILYGQGHPNETIWIQGEELQAILRNLESGLLATTTFELHDGKRILKAIVKDIHYHVASYAIEHIDFAILDPHREVTVNVPITILGLADCVGVKLGGFMRQVIRALKVSCLPKHIPKAFELDIRDLNVAQSKRLSDIAIPDSVRPLGRMNEVAVVIAKKV
ncbi:MAG TPA: 50S ribosomal protein L25 [Chlamydiales bacterium]|jgi:large subunit ribosomal protein L25|nr:50S ribosomal protein L25 [Chlamydiales bacterium]